MLVLSRGKGSHSLASLCHPQTRETNPCHTYQATTREMLPPGQTSPGMHNHQLSESLVLKKSRELGNPKKWGLQTDPTPNGDL